MVRKSSRRMTLRELMVHAEKCAHDLAEHSQNVVGGALADFREVNRPVRRRSHYPTLNAMLNSLQQVESAALENQVMCDYLVEQLNLIMERAREEASIRMA